MTVSERLIFRSSIWGEVVYNWLVATDCRANVARPLVPVRSLAPQDRRGSVSFKLKEIKKGTIGLPRILIAIEYRILLATKVHVA